MAIGLQRPVAMTWWWLCFVGSCEMGMRVMAAALPCMLYLSVEKWELCRVNFVVFSNQSMVLRVVPQLTRMPCNRYV